MEIAFDVCTLGRSSREILLPGTSSEFPSFPLHLLSTRLTRHIISQRFMETRPQKV
jgi:hypothetical protein